MNDTEDLYSYALYYATHLLRHGYDPREFDEVDFLIWYLGPGGGNPRQPLGWQTSAKVAWRWAIEECSEG